MVGMVLCDGPGTVQLLCKHDAYHAVRQGQAGDADAHFGTGLELRIKSVSAADNEDDIASALLPLRQMLR